MAMITEDYVSFETAKLLKEKGFDEHCFCINYPLPEGGHHNIILPNLLNNSMIPFTDEYKFCRYKEDFITIPFLQTAMRWLREVHNLKIGIWYSSDDDDWKGEVFTSGEYVFIGNFISYEEAAEEVIKYCLENLI